MYTTLSYAGRMRGSRQPVARRQRQSGRLFVVRKPGRFQFIRNIDESHGRVADPGISGGEIQNCTFRDVRVQDNDVQVASGRTGNRRVYCDFEIRQIVLVRRQRDRHVPLDECRLDVSSRNILHFAPPFRIARTFWSFAASSAI